MAEIKLRAKQKPTWKDQIRQAVDHTMQPPYSRFSGLSRRFEAAGSQSMGAWENLTYQLLGTNYKSRGTKLGIDYEKETIFNELASRQNPIKNQPAPQTSH
ncbi:relaxase/mobilization nuclease domain-containing protein [Lactiplantibacillus plantarum]|uniref:relaxase/mobilization nuclease domain-containing protein n=1 Tax=Lactiplantibacillus plantarum TaxID=1590 RepID=UPI0021CB6866|nr:relaxase/mobilization nuclease domain-containing protein [Lactiplantibacillus plantarum]